MSSQGDTGLPLAGLRVLDLTRALAGPFCTMILADQGADVVKVEPTPRGEMSRGWGPFDRGVSTYFLSINRNKRSLAVNFRDGRALALLRELAVQADVVVENFRPGTMEELGLGYTALKCDNPRLVFASITGFGRTGPYGDWPGFDQIAQGMSGLMSITGAKGGDPVRVGIPIGDLTGGMWAALGVQSALIQRATTGQGQRVEASLLAGLVGMLCVQGQRYLNLGEVARPAGNDHPVICPYGTFQASDGPFNVATATEDMWRKLCTLLDLDDLAAHRDYCDNAARMAHRDALIARLNARFAGRTRMDWVRALIDLGIPAGPIYDMADVFADPHVRATGMVETVAHPELGDISLLANPLRMESVPDGSVRTPPPVLGADSRTILADYGIAAHRVRALVDAGVVLATEGDP